jgi:hypothetical protein
MQDQPNPRNGSHEGGGAAQLVLDERADVFRVRVALQGHAKGRAEDLERHLGGLGAHVRPELLTHGAEALVVQGTFRRPALVAARHAETAGVAFMGPVDRVRLILH